MNRNEYRRILAAVRQNDVATSAAPTAVYEGGSWGFQLWALPGDYPDDPLWLEIAPHMEAGAFAQPCAYVATVWPIWNETITDIIGLGIETEPFDLRQYAKLNELKNRPADLVWAVAKVRWLLEQVFGPGFQGLALMPGATESDTRPPTAGVDWTGDLDFAPLDRFDPGDLPPHRPAEGKWYWGTFTPDRTPRLLLMDGARIDRDGSEAFPEGQFTWGYLGAGCRDTAVGVLALHFGETITQATFHAGNGRAARPRLYQRFKEEVIARFPQAEMFVLAQAQVQAWLNLHPELQGDETDAD